MRYLLKMLITPFFLLALFLSIAAATEYGISLCRPQHPSVFAPVFPHQRSTHE
jgi:hypothetical protein